MGESSTYQNLSKFEHKAGQIPQVGVENDKASRVNRGRRVDKADRSRTLGRADRSRRVSKTAGRKNIGRASRIGRIRGTRRVGNRSVTINRTKVKKARTIKTEVVGIIKIISNKTSTE